jgi:hypothetical protein
MVMPELNPQAVEMLMKGERDQQVFIDAANNNTDPDAAAAAAAGNENQDPDAIAAAAAAAASQNQPFDIKTYTEGLFETEEEFKASVKEWKDNIAAVREKNEKLSSVLAEVENPFPTDSLASRASFMRATGIHDEDTVRTIMGTTPEELAKDPSLALAIDKVMNNQSLLKMEGVSFETVLNSVREEYGYQGLDEDGNALFDKKDSAKINGGEAVSKITTKRTELGAKKDIFTEANERRQASVKSRQEAEQEWQGPDVLSKLDGFKFEHKFGNEVLNVEGSTEEIKIIRDAVIAQFASSGIKPTDQELEKATNTMRAIFINNNLDKILAAAVAESSAAYKEEANRFFHNGAPIVRPGAGGGKNGNESWSASVFKEVSQ